MNLKQLNPRKKYIAPSILAADFARLEDELKIVEAAGVSLIHIDIMDGHFVPNFSMGPDLVRAIRLISSLPFDVHLMLSKPLRYIKPFAESGADHITVHIEADDNVDSCIRSIRACSCSAGIALRPRTNVDTILPYLSNVDLILVMTVEPGFAGQSFQADQLGKIQSIRQWINESKHPVHLQIDGGIDEDTAINATKAGANILVAGSYIFNKKYSIQYNVARLKSTIQQIDMNNR